MPNTTCHASTGSPDFTATDKIGAEHRLTMLLLKTVHCFAGISLSRFVTASCSSGPPTSQKAS